MYFSHYYLGVVLYLVPTSPDLKMSKVRTHTNTTIFFTFSSSEEKIRTQELSQVFMPPVRAIEQQGYFLVSLELCVIQFHLSGHYNLEHFLP